MSHGMGGEENTVMYSLSFSQSPFIHFEDKGTGSAMKSNPQLMWTLKKNTYFTLRHNLFNQLYLYSCYSPCD